MCERLARGQIIWKFNPPEAPHFGGIWERLVRSCKKAMFAILGNRRLTLPVLTTTMCLVEQTLNARPLTPVRDDPEDLEVLTPIHFLLGATSVSRTLDARRGQIRGLPQDVQSGSGIQSDDLEQMDIRVSSEVESAT